MYANSNLATNVGATSNGVYKRLCLISDRYQFLLIHRLKLDVADSNLWRAVTAWPLFFSTVC